MPKEIKKWRVEFSHNDGREGTVEITTEVMESAAFQYGNGMCGVLKDGKHREGYDLRYCTEKDLHKAMLEDYFGEGLVKATEV